MTHVTEQEIYKNYEIISTSLKDWTEYQIPFQYTYALKNTNLEQCVEKVREIKQSLKLKELVENRIVLIINGYITDAFKELLEESKNVSN